MGLILDKIRSAFEDNTLMSLSVVILATLLVVLVHELWNMRYNQVRSQVSMRLGKEIEKKVDIAQMITDRFEEFGDKIELQLKQANVLFTKREYFTFLVAGIGAGAFIGFVVFPAGKMWLLFFGWVGSSFIKAIFARLLAGLALGAAGSLFPKIWLQRLISKRKKLLQNQIQESLLNMADALKSGHVIQEAIRIVGKEMPYPLGPEFRQAHREMETGKTLFVALNDMKQRVGLNDFTMAINAIEIQFEVGGKLEPLLRKMVKIIQDRVELKQEMDKTIASSKTVGYFLLGAPIFFIGMFSMMSSDTYIEMLKNPIGIVMVGIALICYGVAAAIIVYILRDLSKEI